MALCKGFMVPSHARLIGSAIRVTLHVLLGGYGGQLGTCSGICACIPYTHWHWETFHFRV